VKVLVVFDIDSLAVLAASICAAVPKEFTHAAKEYSML
jgi:hypothetical protein